MRAKWMAEAVGTFAPVFAGAGAATVNEPTGSVMHMGVSRVFGLVVMAMIYAFGEISGASMNPARSLGPSGDCT